VRKRWLAFAPVGKLVWSLQEDHRFPLPSPLPRAPSLLRLSPHPLHTAIRSRINSAEEAFSFVEIFSTAFVSLCRSCNDFSPRLSGPPDQPLRSRFRMLSGQTGSEPPVSYVCGSASPSSFIYSLVTFLAPMKPAMTQTLSPGVDRLWSGDCDPSWRCCDVQSLSASHSV